MGNKLERLTFPKTLFTRKEVESFRQKELEFSKAWNLTATKRKYVLTLSRRQAKKLYFKKKR